MATDLHLYKLSLVNPLIQSLGLSQAEIWQLKKRHFIDNYQNNNDTYLSTYRTHQLIQELWLLKPSSSFMERYARIYQNYSFGEFRGLSSETRSLKDNLKLFIAQSLKLKSNIEMGVQLRFQTMRLTYSFPDKRTLGTHILEQIWLLTCISTICSIVGEKWVLKEIHVPFKSIEGLLPILPKNCYSFKFEQSEFRLIYENNSASLDSGFQHFSYHTNNQPNYTALEKIEKILMSFEPGYRPTLKDLAVLFGFSARTIKRILKKENTNFTNLIDTSIFYKALPMLSSQELSIEEISENLGFSDSPNFIRSFKRWTGTSPGVFRDTFLKMSA